YLQTRARHLRRLNRAGHHSDAIVLASIFLQYSKRYQGAEATVVVNLVIDHRHVFLLTFASQSTAADVLCSGLGRSAGALRRRGRSGAARDHALQVGQQWVYVLGLLPFGGQILEHVMFADQTAALVAPHDRVKEGAVRGVPRVLALNAFE